MLLAALCLHGPVLDGGERPPAAPPPASAAEAARLATAGRQGEALAMVEKLLAASPQDVPAQRLRQDLMISSGRRDELLAAYAREDGNPTMRALLRYLRARAETAPEKRRAELERVTALEPRNFWAVYDLVPLCTAAGDLKAAERWATAARDLRPGDPDVRNVLGDVCLQAGKLKEAEVELAEALRLRPKFPQALYNLGLLRAAAGKAKDAADLFARAIEESPGFAEAWNNRGHCLAKLDQADESVACYRKAVELKPDYGVAWNNLAVALYRKSDFWGAWAALEKAEKCGYTPSESFKRVLSKKLFPDKAPAPPAGK